LKRRLKKWKEIYLEVAILHPNIIYSVLDNWTRVGGSSCLLHIVLSSIAFSYKLNQHHWILNIYSYPKDYDFEASSFLSTTMHYVAMEVSRDGHNIL